MVIPYLELSYKGDMKYINIDGLDKPISSIIFGTAISPFIANQDNDSLLDEVVALGITTFDMAREYGSAEKVIGRWMKKHQNRDQLVLLSKCGHPNPLGIKRVNRNAMMKDLEKSLKDLETDHIDIYLLHRDDPKIDVSVPVEVFNEMHAAGKIKAFGGSNWTHERIAAANEYAYKKGLIPFTVSSPNFGLAEQVKDPWGGGCVTISGKSNAAARKFYREAKIPVIAYSSLGRGLFSGKLKGVHTEDASKILDSFALKGYGYEENYERLRRCEKIAERKGVTVPQIALAWIYTQGLDVAAVVSSTKPERIRSNADALNINLSSEEAAYLNLETDNYR